MTELMTSYRWHGGTRAVVRPRTRSRVRGWYKKLRTTPWTKMLRFAIARAGPECR